MIIAVAARRAPGLAFCLSLTRTGISVLRRQVLPPKRWNAGRERVPSSSPFCFASFAQAGVYDI